MDESFQSLIIALVTVILSFIGKDVLSYLLAKRKEKLNEPATDMDNESRQLSIVDKYRKLVDDVTATELGIRTKFDQLVKEQGRKQDAFDKKLMESAGCYELELKELRAQIEVFTSRLIAAELYGKQWFEYSCRLQTQLKLYNIIPVPFDPSVITSSRNHPSDREGDVSVIPDVKKLDDKSVLA